jgi:hypothetical protein
MMYLSYPKTPRLAVRIIVPELHPRSHLHDRPLKALQQIDAALKVYPVKKLKKRSETTDEPGEAEHCHGAHGQDAA